MFTFILFMEDVDREHKLLVHGSWVYNTYYIGMPTQVYRLVSQWGRVDF